MIKEIKKLENSIDKSNPHGSNLLTKIKLYKDTKSQTYLEKFAKKYIELFNLANNQKKITKEFLKTYAEKTDEYLFFLRNNIFFSHQSDLISSVIPEFFCQLYKIKLLENKKKYNVSGQENLKIDFQLQHNKNKQILFKEKRVDVAVFENVDLDLNSSKSKIIIPIIALEIKVNLDKNMIYGIINTSESIKKLFPNSLYCCVTEFADLDLKTQNFKYSDIDEIYILRKQKRSEYRRNKKLNKINIELVEHNLKMFEKKISNDNLNDLSLESKMSKFGRLIV